MRSPRSSFLLVIAVLCLMSATSVAAQDEPAAPADTAAGRDALAAVDTLAPADSARFPTAVTDPRFTLLGDTLGLADTVRPRFSELPEIYPDSLVDPYTLERPGAWAEWVLSGDQLLGRGAQSLLDVLEGEALVLGQDLGGGGVSAFLGSPLGSHTNVQAVVDGVPVGSPLSASWDLRQIPLEGIARVAWYPGPQTAAWGGAGTGGVLAITTRRSLAASARSLLAFSVGSFDHETFGGNLGRPITERGSAFVGANFDATDGFLRTGDFTRNQLVAKADWRFGERHRVEVSRLSDGFSGEANMPNLFGTQDQDAVILHAFYAGSAGPLSLRAHTYRTSQNLSENFTYRDVQGLFGKGERTGARSEVDVRKGSLMAWGAGAWEEAEVTSLHAGFLRADGSSILEPPAEDDPGAPFVVNPRRRTEWGGGFGYVLPDGRFAANGSLRRLDHGDAAEAGTAWQIEAVGRPVEGVTVRAVAGRAPGAASPMGQAILASRAAAGLEIHPGRASAPGELETWTGWRGEVAWSRAGWRIAAGASGAKGEDAFLWLPPTAWLYFDPTDIETVRLGEPGFNTFDVVELSAQGLEGEVVLPLPWDLEGRLRARRIELTEEGTGAQVPYVPRTQALAQLRYASRFFPSRDLLLEARLTSRYSGERSTLSGETLADYLVGDLLVQATIINFTIFVSFKNISGQGVRSEEAFLLPGREGFFGVNWRFRN